MVGSSGGGGGGSTWQLSGCGLFMSVSCMVVTACDIGRMVGISVRLAASFFGCMLLGVSL